MSDTSNHNGGTRRPANGSRPVRNGQRTSGAARGTTGGQQGTRRSATGASGTRSASASRSQASGTRRPSGQSANGQARRTASGGYVYDGVIGDERTVRAENVIDEQGNEQRANRSRSDKEKAKRRAAAKKKKARRRNLLILEIILLLVLLGGLFYWLKIGSAVEYNDIGPVEVNELPEQTEEALKGYTNIALFGVDNRKKNDYGKGTRSDTIIIASINNDSGEVKLLSIYRDTFLDVGSGKYQKCNAAYSKGGPEQAIAMVNRNLDLNIQDYIAVDFNALVQAVDAVGGIELDITQEEAEVMNFHSSDPNNIGYIDEIVKVVYGSKEDPSKYYVTPGHITANGVQATAYCRVRYTAGDDFKRTSRQREVLSKLVEKAKNANITTLNGLINSMYGNISSSLSVGELLAMAAEMHDYSIVDSAGFPFDHANGNVNSEAIVVPCTLESNVRKMYEYFFNDTTYVPSQTVVDHSDYIVNVTGATEASAGDYPTYEY